MLVAVGLTTTDLKSLDHNEVALSSAAALEVYPFTEAPANRATILSKAAARVDKCGARVAAGGKLTVKVKPSGLEAYDGGKKLSLGQSGWLLIKSARDISFLSVKRAGAKGNVGAKYHGSIAVFEKNGQLRIALILDLDKYLRGVLQSEIPASYHIEAIKAQAVAARTYGLNPRISHDNDVVNVCDSYLCCQYFGGLTTVSSPVHEKAIHETLGQVLVFEDKPILALFSSNAGGHTENYENCFSDPETGEFPPPRRPYLVGVPETNAKVLFNLSDEQDLRRFYNGAPHTVDSNTHHFKWKVHLTADDLESNIHATVKAMMKDERAPFVVAPSGGRFGHIENFSVDKRGVSGCAIEVSIKTSGGVWKVKKELVIRDLFKVSAKKLARLKSGRIFFDYERDAKGDIASVAISGLGWGHGVGLQQTGAQGWAKQGSNYRSILAHYFRGARIDKV